MGAVDGGEDDDFPARATGIGLHETDLLLRARYHAREVGREDLRYLFRGIFGEFLEVAGDACGVDGGVESSVCLRGCFVELGDGVCGADVEGEEGCFAAGRLDCLHDIISPLLVSSSDNDFVVDGKIFRACGAQAAGATDDKTDF